MFSEADRRQAYDRVLEWARADPRVVAGAVVGSLAHQPGDRWSDLDLTFAVADGVGVHDFRRDEALRRAAVGGGPLRLRLHHAVRAHVCIERGRYWQAEYWISSLRDNAMSLACRRRDVYGNMYVIRKS